MDFEAVLGRMEQRFKLDCDEGQASCPYGVRRQVNALEAELRRTAATASVATLRFETLRTSLATFDASAVTFVAHVRSDTVTSGLRQLWSQARSSCGIKGPTVDCNRDLAAVVKAFEQQLAVLQGSAGDMTRSYRALSDAWQDVLAVTGDLGGQVPTARQRLALEVGNVLESTGDSLAAIARASAPEFRQVFFDRLLPTYTAERLLDFIERQFEPLDRLVERADDRVYMLGSIAVEWKRPQMQKALNDFYVGHVRKEFRSTSSARAFARAACVRLAKPSPAGRAQSMVMPFLYTTMTLVEEEVTAQETGKSPTPPGAVTPLVTPGILLDRPGLVYSQCLAAERKVHRQLGAAGQRAESAAVRTGSQKACAEALVESEQRAPPEAPQPPELAAFAQVRSPGSAEVTQLNAKVEAQVERLSLTTLEPQPAPVAVRASEPPAAPPTVAKPAPFCPRVASALRDASCAEDDAGVWVEFDQGFGTGQTGAPALVPTLRMLGRLVETEGRVARMEVHGLASAAPMSCRQWRSAIRGQDPCASLAPAAACTDGDSGASGAMTANQLLARGRACWAAEVVRAKAPSLRPASILVAGSTSDQRGNPGFDRVVSIRLVWTRPDANLADRGTR